MFVSENNRVKKDMTMVKERGI